MLHVTGKEYITPEQALELCGWLKESNGLNLWNFEHPETIGGLLPLGKHVNASFFCYRRADMEVWVAMMKKRSEDHELLVRIAEGRLPMPHPGDSKNR